MNVRDIFEALTEELQDKQRRKTMSAIHADFDKEFLDSLGEWISGQHIKNGTLLNALVYEVAYRIFLGISDETEACAIVTSYGDYMHQAVHRMYHEHGNKPEILALRAKVVGDKNH